MKPEDKVKYNNRVAKARLKKPKMFNYLKYHPKYPNTLEKVMCKYCGSMIRGLVEDERFNDVRQLGNKVVVYKRLVMACMPDYVEVTIEFEDGTAHVTNMCKKCSITMKDSELEELYMADLDMLEQTGAVITKETAEKKPKKIVR